ncbi:COPII coat assembly protein sec16-like [Amphibalanus amphitrite]|uniref:COPII coat assembly protein sec16-like n=1 Tax=Amphibalanus amphitrite TaxID=1232801 RepID=UPI001C905614|nr:COPII coat assembly protein sec16-like [Amphibalanus amphitrite]
MRLFLIACAACAVVALPVDELLQQELEGSGDGAAELEPEPGPSPSSAHIMRQSFTSAAGSFEHRFRSSDGTSVSTAGEQRRIGDGVGTVMRGSYYYVAPGGEHVEITWVADETGFKAFGPMVPEAPAYLAKLLARPSVASAITREDEEQRILVEEAGHQLEEAGHQLEEHQLEEEEHQLEEEGHQLEEEGHQLEEAGHQLEEEELLPGPGQTVDTAADGPHDAGAAAEGIYSDALSDNEVTSDLEETPVADEATAAEQSPDEAIAAYVEVGPAAATDVTAAEGTPAAWDAKHISTAREPAAEPISSAREPAAEHISTADDQLRASDGAAADPATTVEVTATPVILEASADSASAAGLGYEIHENTEHPISPISGPSEKLLIFDVPTEENAAPGSSDYAAPVDDREDGNFASDAGSFVDDGSSDDTTADGLFVSFPIDGASGAEVSGDKIYAADIYNEHKTSAEGEKAEYETELVIKEDNEDVYAEDIADPDARPSAGSSEHIGAVDDVVNSENVFFQDVDDAGLHTLEDLPAIEAHAEEEPEEEPVTAASDPVDDGAPFDERPTGEERLAEENPAAAEENPAAAEENPAAAEENPAAVEDTLRDPDQIAAGNVLLSEDTLTTIDSDYNEDYPKDYPEEEATARQDAEIITDSSVEKISTSLIAHNPVY